MGEFEEIELRLPDVRLNFVAIPANLAVLCWYTMNREAAAAAYVMSG